MLQLAAGSASGPPGGRGRLVARTDRVNAAGLPSGVTEPNAAQHYLAAAALLVTRPEWVAATGALLTAARDGELGDDTMRGRNSAFVDANAEALRLVARANSLDFRGFDTGSPYRYSPTSVLTRLVDAAALERIQQGDGDGSLALVAELIGTLRALSPAGVWALQQNTILGEAAVLLSLTIQHTRPSPDAFRAVATAIESTTGDDDLGRFFLTDRADFIERVGRHLRTGERLTSGGAVRAFVLRPWVRHRVNRALERLNELVEATEQPWPQRLSAINAAASARGEPGTNSRAPGELSREWSLRVGHYRMWARYIGHTLAMKAALHAVTATELYRSEQGALPDGLFELRDVSRFADPMTGDALRFRRTNDGYVVYSPAVDGIDDDGDLGTLSPFSVMYVLRPDESPDWGVQVRLPETEAP